MSAYDPLAEMARAQADMERLMIGVAGAMAPVIPAPPMAPAVPVPPVVPIAPVAAPVPAMAPMPALVAPAPAPAGARLKPSQIRAERKAQREREQRERERAAGMVRVGPGLLGVIPRANLGGWMAQASDLDLKQLNESLNGTITLGDRVKFCQWHTNASEADLRKAVADNRLAFQYKMKNSGSNIVAWSSHQESHNGRVVLDNKKLITGSCLVKEHYTFLIGEQFAYLYTADAPLEGPAINSFAGYAELEAAKRKQLSARVTTETLNPSAEAIADPRAGRHPAGGNALVPAFARALAGAAAGPGAAGAPAPAPASAPIRLF